MQLLICGSRTLKAYERVCAVLDRDYNHIGEADVVITGGASGADSFGAAWAEGRGVAHAEYPAEWDKHGRRAGMLRNASMLALLDPDDAVVLAFVDKPVHESRGTFNMVSIAQEKGVPIRIFRMETNA